MSSKIIILADSMSSLGGAEKTLSDYAESLSSKYVLVYINTEELTPADLHYYRDCTWILGNFYWLIKRGLLDLFSESINKYYVFNFDYMFCPSRNLEYHTHLTGKPLAYDSYVRKVDEFLSKSVRLLFMSELQKSKYFKNLKLIDSDNCTVLGSLISSRDLDIIEKYRGNKKKPIHCVYHQDTWQKGLKESVKYCNENKINYEILPKLPYSEFLEKLSSYSCLVFLPNGGDTAPRLVIEASLLGLDLIINCNVEHRDEEWFKDRHIDTITNHINSLPKKFQEATNL